MVKRDNAKTSTSLHTTKLNGNQTANLLNGTLHDPRYVYFSRTPNHTFLA